MATHRTRKNGVIIIKTIIPIEKKNGVILNGKKKGCPMGTPFAGDDAGL